jgi:cbb3-type cytochrome oxidase maturation protein
MDVLIYLIPVALVLGLVALFAFLWSLKSGQFEDMEGSANRILFDDEDMQTKPPASPQTTQDDDAKN